MGHPYHQHREHQVSHRRVHSMLKGEPEGATKHFDGGAFSKVTSKSAAESHGGKVAGHKGAKRYARGGKVKSKSGQTNIAIVLPGGSKQGHAPMPMPMPGPAGTPPPMAGPGGPPPGGPPGLPPGLPPPGGMPRARGGRTNHIDGEATKSDIEKWGKRASSNSYYTGGAITGVGRLEKARKKGR